MNRQSPNLVSLGSINEDGSKKMLHPADVKGRFTMARRLVAMLLLIIYVALPWIPVNGFPAVFLDVAERRFHFFGLTLATQDLWVFFFLITGLGFSLFYITSLFGRIWCGWTCPYTVFLEHVFRRVERMIDGDASARRALDNAPWTNAKIFKRVLKHSIFLLLAAIIAHVFLSYFVSISALYDMMKHSPENHIIAFSVVIFLTGALYFSFSWFREQFCVILCPYGRMQSALTDDHSMIIGYDKKRGEPRGKAGDPNAGDCVSCNRCVQVCPTGIDIRNGLQLECIGCAACVDACDDIMHKVGRKPGLVRYDSFVGLGGGKTNYIRPRTIFYTLLLAIGISVFSFSVSRMSWVRASAVRMTGAPFYVENGQLRNQFLIRVINKRNSTRTYKLSLEGNLPPSLKATGIDLPLELAPLGEEVRPVILSMPQADYTETLELHVVVTDVADGTSSKTKPMEFTGAQAGNQNSSHEPFDPKKYLQQ
ncbi:MAG: cytochrome c oxidase accessory protein CcoG [Verrucomicrobiaceae bacterium]|nr:cytochrome c oxidase accessory protein CcoG [Verrucomicrobiaceae bacterium]